MLCFSLGTVPLMLGFGSVVSMLGKRFTRQVLKAGAILVVVMGLSMMVQGGNLSDLNGKVTSIFMAENTGINVDTDGNNSDFTTENEIISKETVDTEKAIADPDETQYITSTLQAGRSYPDITVKAGEPVKWTVEAPDGSINGCNYKIIQQDLGIEYSFEEGENVIEFTPSEAGTYTYTCWMGMITGKIYVES